MPTLLGPDGRPLAIPKANLSREVAAPSLDFWRRSYRAPQARGMTPERLAAILDAAAIGNAQDFLTYAEELEERDPHYAGVLGIRKRAVLGLDRHVESASDDARAVELRDAVENALVQTPQFGGLLAALLDGLAKGYSVVEILWNTRATLWTPARYAWRDPRWFILDPVDGETVRLRDSAGPRDGQPLPPGKFIIHRPRLKMGVAIRGGLARLAAIAGLCRHLVLESWLAYCESYGAPARIAKVDDRFFNAGASAEQTAFLTDLQTKLATLLGADAHAVFPKSVDVDLQETAPGRAEVFERLMDRLEKLISKAVLGRSDASDATAGKLGGEQQSSDVRQDILEGDAEELANTLNEQLVRPFVDLNFGPPAAYPRIILRAPETEDLLALTDMLAKLAPLGLKVEQSIIRDKWGLPDPDPDADVLGTPAAPVVPANAGTQNRALNRGGDARGRPDPTAPLTERLGAEAAPLIDALLNPVRLLLETSADLDEFRAGLLALYPDLDASTFAELMGQAFAVATAAGRFEVLQAPAPAFSAPESAAASFTSAFQALTAHTATALAAVREIAARPVVIEQKLDPIQVQIAPGETHIHLHQRPVIKTPIRDPETGLIAHIIESEPKLAED